MQNASDANKNVKQMKNFMYAFLLFICLNLTAQVEKDRIILRDNRIKKILTFHKDSIGDAGYLREISYVNDSGLVVEATWLNRAQDTTGQDVIKYDEHNLEMEFHSTVNGKSIISTTTRAQKGKYTITTETLTTQEGSIRTIKCKITRNKKRYWRYSNNQLISKETRKKNELISWYTKGNLIKAKTKFYFNDSNQMVKSITVSNYKHKRMPKEVIDLDAVDKKYLGRRYTRKYITMYEYNEMNLRTKKESRLTNSTKKNQKGTYSCESFQYFTE